MDDLLAKFVPQFVELARSRVAVALSAAAQYDQAATTKVARDLHTLAGEAGLLGLSEVAPLARDCELKAKRLHASHTDAEVEGLVAALRQLAQLIEGIGAASPREGGSA